MFGEFALGDVANDGGYVDAVFGFHGAEADFYGEFAAVLALGKKVQRQAHGTHNSCVCKGFAMAGMGGAVGCGDQHIDFLAHQLFAGVAKHCFGGAVGDDDGAVPG